MGRSGNPIWCPIRRAWPGGDGGEPGCGGDLADQVGEHAGGDGGVRLDGPLGMARVVSVEPEDGMEVDEAAALVFGDFGVGEPDADTVCCGEFVEAAPQGDDGAAP